MNFSLLWDVLKIMFSAGASMEILRAGGELHTADQIIGIPPIYTTWRDGRKFEIDLRIKRTA